MSATPFNPVALLDKLRAAQGVGRSTTNFNSHAQTNLGGVNSPPSIYTGPHLNVHPIHSHEKSHLSASASAAAAIAHEHLEHVGVPIMHGPTVVEHHAIPVHHHGPVGSHPYGHYTGGQGNHNTHNNHGRHVDENKHYPPQDHGGNSSLFASSGTAHAGQYSESDWGLGGKYEHAGGNGKGFRGGGVPGDSRVSDHGGSNFSPSPSGNIGQFGGVEGGHNESFGSDNEHNRASLSSAGGVGRSVADSRGLNSKGSKTGSKGMVDGRGGTPVGGSRGNPEHTSSGFNAGIAGWMDDSNATATNLGVGILSSGGASSSLGAATLHNASDGLMNAPEASVANLNARQRKEKEIARSELESELTRLTDEIKSLKSENKKLILEKEKLQDKFDELKLKSDETISRLRSRLAKYTFQVEKNIPGKFNRIPGPRLAPQSPHREKSQTGQSARGNHFEFDGLNVETRAQRLANGSSSNTHLPFALSQTPNAVHVEDPTMYVPQLQNNFAGPTFSELMRRSTPEYKSFQGGLRANKSGGRIGSGGIENMHKRSQGHGSRMGGGGPGEYGGGGDRQNSYHNEGGEGEIEDEWNFEGGHLGQSVEHGFRYGSDVSSRGIKSSIGEGIDDTHIVSGHSPGGMNLDSDGGKSNVHGSRGGRTRGGGRGIESYEGDAIGYPGAHGGFDDGNVGGIDRFDEGDGHGNAHRNLKTVHSGQHNGSKNHAMHASSNPGHHSTHSPHSSNQTSSYSASSHSFVSSSSTGIATSYGSVGSHATVTGARDTQAQSANRGIRRHAAGSGAEEDRHTMTVLQPNSIPYKPGQSHHQYVVHNDSSYQQNMRKYQTGTRRSSSYVSFDEEVDDEVPAVEIDLR